MLWVVKMTGTEPFVGDSHVSANTRAATIEGNTP